MDLVNLYILSEGCTDNEKKKENAAFKTGVSRLPQKVWTEFVDQLEQRDIKKSETINRKFTNVKLFHSFEDALSQSNPIAEIQMTQSVSDLHDNLEGKCLYFYNQKSGA